MRAEWLIPGCGHTTRDAQLEALARGLLDEGQRSEAFALLAQFAANGSQHTHGSALPCLCARCGFEGSEVVADGTPFVRDFVVSWGRALHYWVPCRASEGEGAPVPLVDLGALRRSMRVAVRWKIVEGRRRRSTWKGKKRPRWQGPPGRLRPGKEADESE